MQQLRARNIPAELYHEQAKFDKQFKYAEKKEIPYVVILGSTELAASQVQLKDLRSGRQSTLTFAELLSLNIL
jgi:histidyl-tRNA synthetase